MMITNVYIKERDTTSKIVTSKPKKFKKEDYIVLQLQTKANDICRISKLLVKYNIKASITDSVITLDGDVSDDLLTQLCGSIDIHAVQNFISHEPLYVSKGTSFAKSEKHIEHEVVEEPKKVETTQDTHILSRKLPEYALVYSKVKRGEMYWCDFGEPYGSEQGGYRPAIIIQNDDGNLSSPTTIVIPCTTAHKPKLPTHYICTFSSQNIIDYDLERVGTAENVFLAEHIYTVAKARLRKYIGTLTPEVMEILQEKIDISLHLSREIKTIVKQEKVYVDRPVPKKAMANQEVPKERKDVNMAQVQLLSFVDINELLKISRSYSTDEVKAQKILELFGFDFNKNGVQYLLKAIITSPKDAYFNLETLSESVSQKEGIDKEEIKRLIVARVKERFGFKKSPTIDFIRLINNFLTKQEVDNNEEINI